MKTYRAVHAQLKRERGVARSHRCACGQPATQWAYQHTGDIKFGGPDGESPYSENLDDYTPMCRKCHVRLDMENQENIRAAHGAWIRPMPPEEASKHMSEISRAGGGGVIKRRCLEHGCGVVTSAAALGWHQSRTGHTGWENV